MLAKAKTNKNYLIFSPLVNFLREEFRMRENRMVFHIKKYCSWDLTRIRKTADEIQQI